MTEAAESGEAARVGFLDAERPATARTDREPRIEQLGGALCPDANPAIDNRADANPTIVLGVAFAAGDAAAIAVLTSDGGLLAIHDMPMLWDAPVGRRGVNAPLLSKIVAEAHAKKAYVGRVSTWPGERPFSAFVFGRRRGVIEGVCGALGIPITFVAPPVWRTDSTSPRGQTGGTPRAHKRSDAGRLMRTSLPVSVTTEELEPR